MRNLIHSLVVLVCAGSFVMASQPLSPAPRFKGMGRHHHPITTKWELAQRYFDHGLTLCFNFNHPEAIRSFEAAAQIDPDCAMAYWGVVFALGPHVNAPMDTNAIPKAWEALQKAIALKAKATEKERDYIDALAKRYTNELLTDRAALDKAFAEAMGHVAKKHEADIDAQVLYAEALMDTSPWNYWDEYMTPKPEAKMAIGVIESVLKRVKAHSGADHLYIHLVEAGPNPEKGVPSADRIGRLTPKAGHLVHMASHIYVRVGRYHDAVLVNERAADADEYYMKIAKPVGMYPGGYYPHNVHFLWYANDLEGRSKHAIAAAHKVSEYTRGLLCGAIEGPRQRYLPLLAYARFGRWEDILKQSSPADQYGFDRAMSHYARGLAFAATGEAENAEKELRRFKDLQGSEPVKGMDNPYFPGTQILAVGEHVLTGKIAAARGETNEFVSHMRKAVDAAKELSYMEPPYWYYSAKLSLGAALFKAGQAAEAEKVFREDLKEFPNCGWPLFGLRESLRAQGKAAEAQEVSRQFKKAWSRADVDLSLDWF
jgi:tetratricopeptide (TPR) repeat protein